MNKSFVDLGPLRLQINKMIVELGVRVLGLPGTARGRCNSITKVFKYKNHLNH